MTLYFDSITAALSMDGHGAYVWGAYALTFLVIAALVMVPLQRWRVMNRELRAEQRRAEAKNKEDGVHAS